CSTVATASASWPSRRRSPIAASASRRDHGPSRRRSPARPADGARRTPDAGPPLRIVSVVGTRPQLIKAAALAPALRRRHDAVFVDTGQHWDEAMAGAFFAELDLPRPDHSLGIGGGTQAEQTGRMLPAVAAVLRAEEPDAVLVYGDTNSTLAGALAA